MPALIVVLCSVVAVIATVAVVSRDYRKRRSHQRDSGALTEVARPRFPADQGRLVDAPAQPAGRADTEPEARRHALIHYRALIVDLLATRARRDDR